MPEFEGVTLEGGEPVQSSEYEGKVTLINLWGIWCPPCIQELPHLQKVYEHYKGNPDVRVVAVHSTINEDRSREDVKAWVEERGFELPMIYDDDTSIQDRFTSGGIPENIFINRGGQVVQMMDDRPHETFEDRAIREIERILERGEASSTEGR